MPIIEKSMLIILLFFAWLFIYSMGRSIIKAHKYLKKNQQNSSRKGKIKLVKDNP